MSNMASSVFVIDSTFKRTQVKVQPNTHLRTLLEEACLKLKLDPDQYTLKTDKQKQLDLSLTFRLSALPPGAKLHLVQASRSPSIVNVAITLPPSENSLRLQDRFPSNTSLWLVLRKFEEGVAGSPAPVRKLNLTSRGLPSTDSGPGRLNYEQPCLNAAGRELCTFTDLQKTLAQLGYNSGSVMLRLTFKQDGTPMEEAMALISNYFDSVKPSATSQPVENLTLPPQPDAGPDPSEDTVMTPPPPPVHQTPVPTDGDDVVASSSVTAVPSAETQFPSLQEESDTPAAPSSSTAPAQPKFSVYSAPSGDTPAAAQQAYNPADFAPTIEHAQAHQAVLNRQAQNKRLQSDKELEAAATTKKQTLASVKNVMIRVRFPDQMQVDLPMTDRDTVTALYTTVKDMLEAPNQPFDLRYVGAKGTKETLDPTSDAKLIGNLGLVGRVLVTMVWDGRVDALARQQPVLKEELRGQATKLQIQTPLAQEEAAGGNDAASGQDKKDAPKKKNTGSKADVEARMKKMLGLGGFGKKK